MTRNVDIQSLLFPVKENDVYVNNKRIQGFKAITGILPEGERVFAVVSSNYKLITNDDALKMGKEIHKRLFKDANADTFDIFKIISPHTKSFCQIDIIDKNYKFNIWQKEIFVPFVRIHNSYNRSHSLQFDIGFCRKLCTNGVIFEQQIVKLKYAHTK